MIPTKPTKKTTLVLTAAFQAIGFFNARSAIRNIIVGGVRAVDSSGNIYDWKSWNERKDFPEDQPSLRTARAAFPVPTIVVIPGFFGKFSDINKKNTRISTLRQIYNLYEQTCQYCHKNIKFSLATKDHVSPRSKGGVNYDSNIVLACKKCNNKKASKFPFFDIAGREVKPKILGTVEFAIAADNIDNRPEWDMFLRK
jgi:5-methylcytosine-specific restriction endonuclease McrA